MHTPDWRAVRRRAVPRRAPAASCSTIRRSRSAAALQSVARRAGRTRSARDVEAYRVFRDAHDPRASSRGTASASRAVHRQFVLPIALAQARRLAALHRARRRRARGASACCGCSARRSRSWPSGAGPRHRRHRLHRRPPGARARRRAATRCARSCATPRAARDLPARRHRARRRRPHAIARSLDRAVDGVEVVYHIAALYRQAGLPDDDLPRGQRDRRAASSSRPRPRAGVAARRALQHGRRARRHRASARERGRAARPGDIYQETKLEGERIAREAARAHRHRGDDRAADRHLRPRRSPAAEAVSRRRAAPLRHARRGRDLSTI